MAEHSKSQNGGIYTVRERPDDRLPGGDMLAWATMIGWELTNEE